jgi:hypothetical protein
MHCKSKWYQSNIIEKNLDELTLGDVHLDIRYKWKTLPSMQESGMTYPLVCFAISEDFYWNKFYKATNIDMRSRLPPPSIVNGNVILIKGGNNRYQSNTNGNVGNSVTNYVYWNDLGSYAPGGSQWTIQSFSNMNPLILLLILSCSFNIAQSSS